MNTVSTRAAFAAALVLIAPSLCPASLNTFLFTVSNVISPEQPSATVTLWGGFDPKWYAFGSSRLDVATGPDPGNLSDPMLLLPDKLFSPGHVEPDGDRVSGIVIMQIQFPGNNFADTSNPLAIWSATWTTDDFTPRKVFLWTESKEYFIIVNDAGKAKDFYGIDFSEGASAIQVVPAPSAAPVVISAGAWIGRRRTRC